MAGVAIVVGALFALLLVGPLVVPVPPLRDTVPPKDLADPDGRFVVLNRVDVHHKVAGKGEPGFVLLHGFGGSTFSWREVLPVLGRWGKTVAFDRPGFGLTERPLCWRGPSPYGPEAQVSLTIALMDHVGMEKAVLVAHSAGAAVALGVAVEHPERVAALVFSSPFVGLGSPFPDWVRALLATPQARRVGPLFLRGIRDRGPEGLRRAWHDPHRITPEVMAGYEVLLRVQNWDRGLWEVTLAARPLPSLKRLGEVRVPVLVVVGDDDRLIPSGASQRLAGQIPDARLVLVPDCGHLPHEEKPMEFLAAVEVFLAAHGLLARPQEGAP